MLETYALITYNDLETALEIPNSSKQSLYESLINTASMMVKNITGRNLKKDDYELVLDGNGYHSITLPDYPINSVSELNVDINRNFTSDTIVTDFGIYKDVGVIRLYTTLFPTSPLCVKVNYNSGFEVIPPDIKSAVVEIVSFLYNRRNAKLIGKKSVNTGDGISETWELSVPLNALEILNRYKK